jgi:hypothetical protein
LSTKKKERESTMSIRYCEIEPVGTLDAGYPYLFITGTTPGEGIQVTGRSGSFRVKSDVEKFVGCVVLVRSRQERIMSDVWAEVTVAVVWDSEIQSFREAHVSTDGFNGHWSSAVVTVDGTPEVFEYYEAYLRGEFVRMTLAQFDREVEYRRVEAATIRVGKTVQVVRGRKIPQGTKGIVFYQKEGRWGTQLGIRTSDRKEGRNWADAVWVAETNCAVVGPRGNILAV